MSAALPVSGATLALDNEKRLIDSPTGQSLNRLSKLQKNLIIQAYHHYAHNPRLAPVGTAPQGAVPPEQRPHVGIAHLYSSHAVGAYLGVAPRRSVGNYSGHEHQFRIKSDGWGLRVDPRRYVVAQAVISRAFSRLAARGFVEKKEREFMCAGGIQLTPAGIALGHRLTGIEPTPRAWRATA